MSLVTLSLNAQREVHIPLLMNYHGIYFNNINLFCWKDLTNGIVGIGTWVTESATNDQSTNAIAFENDGIPVPTSDRFGLEWAVGYENYWTGTLNIFLNSKGQLANNDGKALANFVCQHKAQGSNSEYVIKPLVRSLLADIGNRNTFVCSKTIYLTLKSYWTFSILKVGFSQ